MTQLSNGQHCVAGAVALSGVSPAAQVLCHLSEWCAWGLKAIKTPWILLGMAGPWMFIWGYLLPIPDNIFTIWNCSTCRMLLISMYKWSKLLGFGFVSFGWFWFFCCCGGFCLLFRCDIFFRSFKYYNASKNWWVFTASFVFYFRDKLNVLAFLKLLCPHVSVLDACILKRIRLDDY